ncbi:MAG: hypothetical protein QM710_14460 [Flavobacterium sp.]
MKPPVIFPLVMEIGGKSTGGRGTSSDTGQFYDDNIDPYDIGGRSGTGTGEVASSFDTGGGKGTSSDTGQRNDPTYTDPFDIGGNGGVIIGRPEIALVYVPGFGCFIETGGGKGTSTNPGDRGDLDDIDPYDIGGHNDTSTGGFVYTSDTGGRSGHGTSTSGDYGDDDDDYDTGGRGSRGTTGEFAQTYVWLDSSN